MAFNRFFDEEIGRAAQLSCVNDGAIADAKAYGFELDDEAEDFSGIAAGIYDAFLKEMDAGKTVLFRVRRVADGEEHLVTPTDTPIVLSMFPGSVVARIRFMPGKKVLTARLLSGTGTLYLVPIVPL